MNTTKVLRHQLRISRLNNQKRFGLEVRHFIDARSKLEPKCVPQLFLGLLLGIHQLAIGQSFPCPLKQSQKSLQNLTLVAKVANKGDNPRFFSSP